MTEGQVPNPDFKKPDSKAQVSMEEGNKVNVVKELLCPQLLAALVAGGLFAYTVVKPISVPVKSRGAAPQTATKEAPKVVVKEDPTLNTDKLLKEVANTEPLKSFEAGKVSAATGEAWTVADRKSDRQNVRKLMAAGNVLTSTGNIRDSWKGFVLLERSQALAPQNKWVRLNYARQLFKRGLIKESIQQYEDLLKLTEETDANWVEPRLELADVYLAEEQTKLAIKLYEDCLKIKNEDPRIIKRIGIAKAVSGDQKKGYDEFIKGCNLEQDKMDYSPDIKADIDKNGGLIESAITDMRKKVAAKPTDIPLRIRLGKLLICVNRLKEAKE
ncbi:MAG: tetratricopeptide repeat protein, partial [Candidatus Obscuribacterales bacterium]|nr:tetratricopeptide repeat protein [Candidatus Obscuribacterales bacterium]